MQYIIEFYPFIGYWPKDENNYRLVEFEYLGIPNIKSFVDPLASLFYLLKFHL